MRQFPEHEVQQVLDNLSRRWPNATREDAMTILRDGEWAEQDERRFADAEDAAIEREFDAMAASA
jgi:hypothetical protein